jgi:CheY-like chemotaxis protein
VDWHENYHTLRTLVVDDDPVVCHALAGALTDAGLAAEPHMRGADALEAEGTAPVLAFVDVVMPDMDGLDLAARLREKWPGIELVFVSGAADSGRVIRALQLGASDYLVKPYTPEALRLCLSRFHERLALRRRAALAERRYATLIQNVPLLIFRLREDLSLEFVNNAVQPMLGFAPEEATASDSWLPSRVRMKDRGRVRRVLAQAFSSKYPLTVQCRLVHRRGFDVHGILKTMPRGPEPGAAILDGVFMDISERIYLEHSRVMAEKIKTIGAISEEVAHEIRNPLMSIGGFARRLSAKAPDFPETEIILRESRRLEKLLERIRGYLNPLDVRTGPLALGEVLAAALERLMPGLTEADIAVQALFEPRLPEACADPDILDQVFTILLQDAARALTSGGSLNVRTFATGDSVCASFDYELRSLRDIDPERLYLPYEDGGFGLPNCYSMVQRMGGVMTMTREGGSAVFTVSLPRRDGERDTAPVWLPLA